MKRMVACVLILMSVAACTDEDAGKSARPHRTRSNGSPASIDGYAPGRRVGRIEDISITESSGIAASATQPGSFWTHNDSGGSPFIFCLEEDGRSCGAVRVLGAGMVDWEDIARGPGPTRGQSYLYIGDIGDNTASRESVTVYRLEEPVAGANEADAEMLSLSYPDGPHDAETLMVHPRTGDLYIVSKGEDPIAYVARAPLEPSMELEIAGKADVPGLLPGPTGGDISPDGRRLVLSHYTGVIEFEIRAGARFDSIWRTEPTPIAFPPVVQREAVAYSLDGLSVITTSEGDEAPIQRATHL